MCAFGDRTRILQDRSNSTIAGFHVHLENNGRSKRALGSALVKGESLRPANCQVNQSIEDQLLWADLGIHCVEGKTGFVCWKTSKSRKASDRPKEKILQIRLTKNFRMYQDVLPIIKPKTKNKINE